MNDNPYKAPVDAPTPPSQARLRHGRNVLLTMGTIVVTIFVWQMVTRDPRSGWSPLPQQSFQTLIPLMLLGLLWIGRRWARYALAAFSTMVLATSAVPQLGKTLSFGHYDDLALLLVSLAGHCAIVMLALFSRHITELLDYRRDIAELGRLRSWRHGSCVTTRNVSELR